MVSERKPIMGVAPPPGNKRHKADGMPPDGMPPGHMPQRYPQQGYGPPGYMGWQGQYGSHPPPPHGWQGAPAQGPPGMYPQRGGPPMTPERPGNWNGYRSPPPHHQPPPPHAPGKGQPPPPRVGGRPMKPGGKVPKPGESPGPMPPQQYGPSGGPPGWSGGGQPWGGPQWSGGPPPPPGQWHGGHPQQMHQPPPPHYQSGWAGASQTPPRRPRASPDMMSRGMMGGPGSYPPPGPGVCPPVGMDAPPPSDSDMYMSSRGVGMHDDEQSSVGGRTCDKDKGRGSYKCGRCGVPKKGHVCPYQPKVKRRSGEPAPEMKSAAIQVEMDEFMTLRRLNIRIQGYPESYAADPTMSDMVVGEPRTPMPRPMMATPDVPPPMMGCPDAPRSSPHPPGPGPGATVTPGLPLNEPTKG